MSERTWACLAQDGGCACRCHLIQAGRATGKVRRGAINKGGWTPADDARVREGVRTGQTLGQIARPLGRTANAIRHRVEELDLSMRTGWFSLSEVSFKLGVGWHRACRWRESGALTVRRRRGTAWWSIREVVLERFVERYAGELFDAAKVRDPRLRALAQVAATANQRAAGRSA